MSPRQVCRDKGFNVAIKSSISAIQGKTTLLRQKKVCRDNKFMLLGETLSQKRQILSRHKLRITTERMSQHSRDCCNKVEEMEEEIFVTTKDNHVAT